MKKICLLLFGLMTCFILTGCSSEKEMTKVDKITTDILVSNFNQNLVENNIEYPASEESLIKDNGVYWYTLYEDIDLYFYVENYTEDKSKDIVIESGLFYDKDSVNYNLVKKYLYYLLKANNSELTIDEINEMIEKAIEYENSSDPNLEKNEGKGYSKKGIMIAHWQNDTENHFSVTRIYEKEN